MRQNMKKAHWTFIQSKIQICLEECDNQGVLRCMKTSHWEVGGKQRIKVTLETNVIFKRH